jgi:hypothetical protein
MSDENARSGFWSALRGSSLFSGEAGCSSLGAPGNQDYYLEKIRVFKAGVCLDTLAWNNEIGLWFYFVGLRTNVMMNRDSWGH